MTSDNFLKNARVFLVLFLFLRSLLLRTKWDKREGNKKKINVVFKLLVVYTIFLRALSLYC